MNAPMNPKWLDALMETATAAARAQSATRAVAYLDATDPNAACSETQVEWLRAQARAVGAELSAVYRGRRELPRFVSALRSNLAQHYFCARDGQVELEAHIVTARGTGHGGTTLHLARPFFWILPKALENIISDVRASKSIASYADLYRADASAGTAVAEPRSADYGEQDAGVIRRDPEARRRAACIYLDCHWFDATTFLYSACVKAHELRARVRGAFREDRKDDGKFLRRMIRGMRIGRYKVALFENGHPAELSVSVSVATAVGRVRSFELVSSISGAGPLLQSVASLIDKVI